MAVRAWRAGSLWNTPDWPVTSGDTGAALLAGLRGSVPGWSASGLASGTSDSWKAKVSGNWTTKKDWSTGAVPTASVNATIAVAGTYTVSINTAVAANALTLNSAHAVVADTGTLSLGASLVITAGTFALDAGGAIASGTLSVGKAGELLANGGTLVGVTYDGTLNIAASAGEGLTVAGGITFAGAGGSGLGTVNLTGVETYLAVQDASSLNNVTINIADSYYYGSDYGLQLQNTSSNNETLTLGSHVTINDAGRAGDERTNLYLSGSSGATETVVNTGTIAVDSNQSPGLYISDNGYGALINQGIITVGKGDALTISASQFLNNDVVAISTGGLTVNTTDFGNAGSISVDDGNLTIDTTTFTTIGNVSIGANGTFSLTTDLTTVQLGTYNTASGGTFVFGGALNNAGSTLTLSANNALTLTGSISGGTISDAGGNLSADGGTLTSVTYDGTLNLGANVAEGLTATGGITFAGAGGSGLGTVNLMNFQTYLVFQDASSLSNVIINIGDSYYYSGDYGLQLENTSSRNETLTLASSVTINDTGGGYRANLYLSGASGATETVINKGVINADASGSSGLDISDNGFGALINQGTITVGAGDTLTVSTAQFLNSAVVVISDGGLTVNTTDFGNAGSISVNNGNLTIDTTTFTTIGNVSIGATGTFSLTTDLTTVQLGTYNTASGGTFVFGGALNNAGSTLTLSANNALTLTGSISGGTISDAGGNLSADGGTLSSVTYDGTLNLAANVAEGLTATGGITFAGAGGSGLGTVNLTNFQTYLVFQDASSLSNVIINIGDSYYYSGDYGLQLENTSSRNETLTLASSVTINDTGGGYRANLYLSGASGATETVINKGVINADASGSAGLDISDNGYGSFINEDKVVVGNGDTLTIDTAQVGNSGSISVAGGDLTINTTTFGNRGKISVSGGGTVTLSANVTTAALGKFTTASSGVFELSATDTITNTGATLSLGSGSALTLGGSVVGGTIADSGGGLISIGATLSDVTYEGSLAVSAGITLADKIVFTGAGGAGTATVTIAGYRNYCAVYNVTSLSNVKFDIQNTNDRYQGLRFVNGAVVNQTLTLASNVNITDAGSAITYVGGVYLTGAIGATETVVDQGTISLAVKGGPGIYLKDNAYGNFVNAGLISVANGDQFHVETAQFSNTGSIAVSGKGTLTLATSLTTAELGSFTTTSGGVFVLASGATLTNIGATLALGTGDALTLGGNVVGGTITDSGGGLITSKGTLSDLTYEGTLAVSAGITLDNTILFTGTGGAGAATVTIAGYRTYLDTYNVTSLSNVTFDVENTGGGPDGLHFGNGAAVNQTLTLAGNVNITDAASAKTYHGGVYLYGSSGATETVIDQGTINLSVSGGVGIYITDNGFGNFVNAGLISVTNGDHLYLGTTQFSNGGSLSVSENGTLTLATSLTTAQLGTFSTATGGVFSLSAGATLTNTGATLTLGAGNALTLGGSVVGGTIADSGGGLISDGGTLSSVAYEGTLAVTSGVTLANSILFSGVGGSGAAMVTIEGDANTCSVDNVTSLSNVTFDIKNTNDGRSGLVFENSGAVGETLTLAGNVNITDAGSAKTNVGGIYLSGSKGATETVVDIGTINLSVSGGIGVYLQDDGYGNFVNAGLISVSNGDNLYLDTKQFSNSGTLSVSENGTLTLGSTLTTAQLGTFTTATGGVFYLYSSATLTNTGATLALGAGNALTLGGSVVGGTITDSGGGLMTQGGTLSGVTYDGTLAVTNGVTLASSILFAGTGGTGAATITIAGDGNSCSVDNVASLSNVTFDVQNTNHAGDGLRFVNALAGNKTLTLASNVSITDAGAAKTYVGGIYLSGAKGALETVVDNGTINLAVNGGVGVYLTDNGFGNFVNAGLISVANGDLLYLHTAQFSNTGSISVSDNGTLDLATNLTTAQLGTFSTTAGGVFSLYAGSTLTNTGATLTLESGNALTLGGSVVGGTIADFGGGLIAEGGTLSDVTYEGTLSVTNGVKLTNGTTFDGAGGTGAGSVVVNGANSYLAAYNLKTLANVTFDMESTTARAGLYLTNSSAVNETLTLASSVTITDAGSAETSIAGVDLSGASGAIETVVDQGTINLAVNGGPGLYITDNGYGNFVNAGLISVANGDELTVDTARFSNSGSIVISSGDTIVVESTFTNTGAITIEAGGELDLTNGGTLGGTISGPGELQLENAAPFTIESTITVGTLLVDNGATIIGATVENGNSLVVSAGGTANQTTVQNQAAEFVLSGGAAASSVIDAGGTLVFMGGAVTKAQLLAGATGIVINGAASGVAVGTNVSLLVSAGGTANLTSVTSGFLTISAGGLASASIVSGGGTETVLAGGVSENSIIATGGMELVNGGVASSLAVNRGMTLVQSGGSAVSATISGGSLTVGLGGASENTLVNSGGTEIVLSGGTTTSSTVNSGGTELVSGGMASSLSVNRGMTLVESGGFLFSATLSRGGVMVSQGGSALSTTVSSGGTETVLAGGTTTSSTINAGGMEVVNGGVASSLAVNRGMTLVESGGRAISAVLSGGSLMVGQGGVTQATMVNSGGNETVLAGGTTTSSTVSSGGTEVVNGGIASALAVNRGMTLVESGGSIISAVLSGGSATVSSGGTANFTVVSSGGTQTVLAGGSAVSATVKSGGIQVVSGGFASATSVAAGGTESLVGGGTVGAVSGAGTLMLTSGVFTGAGSAIATSFDTVGPGATLSATGSISGALVVNSTGAVTVSAGTLAFLGTITNSGTVSVAGSTLSFADSVSGTGALVVGNSGTLALANGASATQALDFGGSDGLLDLMKPLTFLGVISNFGSGDVISLLNTNFTTFSVNNDTLSVLDGTKHVATLEFNGNYTSSSFTLTASGGNTVIGFN